MAISYLIKRKTLLQAGIQLEGSDSKVVSFNNIYVKLLDGADPDTVHAVIPTQAEVNRMITDSIANSHKQIAGSIQFDTYDEFKGAFGVWESGGAFDLTGPDGEEIHYTHEKAKIGDIIFVSCSAAPGSDEYFFTEEVIIVDADKNAELLTHNNEQNAKFKRIEQYKTKTDQHLTDLDNEDIRLNGIIDSNLTKIRDRYTKAQVDGKIRGVNSKIITNTQNIAANLGKINQNITEITDGKSELTLLNNRFAQLEKELEDTQNIWRPDSSMPDGMPLQASMDVHNIPGSLGTFDFTTGRKFTVKLKKGTDIIPGTLEVGGAATDFTKGTHTVSLEISDKGVITATTSTGDQLSSWHVIEAIQQSTVITNTYTKHYIDTTFVTKTAQATKDTTQDGKISANTAALATKQNITDTSLTTTAKTIVGGINENKANLDLTTQDVNDINELKVSDGRKIQDLNSSIYADQIMIKKSFTQNSHKLLENITSANPGEAKIGNGYKGSQSYAENTNYPVHFAALNKNAVFLGYNSTGRIEIGSTLNNAHRHQNVLIQGAKRATFEEIIDAAKNSATKNLSNVNVGTSHSGKILQVKADGTLEYVENSGGGGGASQNWVGNNFAKKDLSNVRMQNYNEYDILQIQLNGSLKAFSITKMFPNYITLNFFPQEQKRWTDETHINKIISQFDTMIVELDVSFVMGGHHNAKITKGIDGIYIWPNPETDPEDGFWLIKKDGTIKKPGDHSATIGELLSVCHISYDENAGNR